ncbi:MAG: aminotransferase class III-fold pyridoxal phosphate-dependent enzyme, partial [Deltaproteobacteria bacterium]|nr:aminotransferase class III-fold pyridoxal phosphate-dependent enzyme [Deltaproteobacteria bacterium]
VGAFGGRADIMDQLAPDGPVYQAGTLSGNPLGVAAGITTLEALERTDPYAHLETSGQRLAEGLVSAAKNAKVPLCVNHVGSMLTAFFCEGPVTDLASAQTSDLQRFGAYHRGMRSRGVFLPPSQFEALFISATHTEADIDKTLETAAATFASL